ncbi:hypothetical protein ACFOGJ_04250 [Marinibaculum pumilum]|uniref:Uncharacterized protein n=1 Tax=Marinibaculum pumilum TaxID=1766165 RepID=A0ABV7KVL5_9PROT
MSIEAARRQPFLREPGQHEPGEPWSAEWRDYLRALYRDPEPARHDSVVIAGDDLAALAFAARLARSGSFAGRIVMLAPPRRMTRQLLLPVGVHAQALAELAEAAGTRAAAAIDAALVQRPITGAGAAGLWGIRQDSLAAALRGVTDGLGVAHVAGCPSGPRQLLRLARGARPLLVNATGNPLLLGTAVPSPRRHLAGVQCAFRETGMKRPGAAAQVRPLRRTAGGTAWGTGPAGLRLVFMPFADPLSPDATFCGLAWLPRRGGLPEAWPDHGPLAEALFAAAHRHGLVPDAPEQTLGWLARALPAGPVEPGGAAPGGLELRRAWEVAPPQFLIDGRAAIAVGRRAAEALLRGEPPLAAAARALQGLRWRSVAAGLSPSFRAPRRRDGTPRPADCAGRWVRER